MERGTRLHSMCEDVLNDVATETPAELQGIARILERLKANAALSEKAWRLDSNWSPVESKSWVLGIVDVHFFRDGALHVYDFKSGKPYASHKKQLELYALIGMSIYPKIQKVECGAIYIDTGKIGYQRSVSRQEADEIRPLWSARTIPLFADEELLPKRGSGCFWCTYKDSLGGPCAAWRK